MGSIGPTLFQWDGWNRVRAIPNDIWEMDCQGATDNYQITLFS